MTSLPLWSVTCTSIIIWNAAAQSSPSHLDDEQPLRNRPLRAPENLVLPLGDGLVDDHLAGREEPFQPQQAAAATDIGPLRQRLLHQLHMDTHAAANAQRNLGIAMGDWESDHVQLAGLHRHAVQCVGNPLHVRSTDSVSVDDQVRLE